MTTYSTHLISSLSVHDGISLGDGVRSGEEEQPQPERRLALRVTLVSPQHHQICAVDSMSRIEEDMLYRGYPSAQPAAAATSAARTLWEAKYASAYACVQKAPIAAPVSRLKVAAALLQEVDPSWHIHAPSWPIKIELFRHATPSAMYLHAKFTSYLPGMACFAVAWHVMEHAHTIRHNMFSGSFPIAHQPAQRQPV